ncbi:MAG: hypothetical protein M5T61_09790 [Acidimicrobiia bacterium]|nr:hypothetical protein [Acidimicrobiia bacterium]
MTFASAGPAEVEVAANLTDGGEVVQPPGASALGTRGFDWRISRMTCESAVCPPGTAG